MAKKLLAARSTFWAISDGPKTDNKPYQDGDYRYYWEIYYEQTDEDKKPWNNRSKVTVIYYIQTHKSISVYADVVSYPSGTSTTKIDNTTLKSIKTSSGSIVVGDDYKLKKIGEASKYITHNATGDASFVWQGSGFSMNTSPSTYSLPHIDRYSYIGDISEFNIDDGITIPILKYVQSYYNKLEIIVANQVIREVNGVTEDVNIIFTEDELDTIYTLVPTGEQTDFTIKLTTYTNNGMSSVVGTHSKSVVGYFNIILPTVNGAICTDTLVGTEDYTGDTTKQTIIRNASYVEVNIPSSNHATANTRKSTIVEYVIDNNHVSYNTNGVSINLGFWNKDVNGVTIYAVDSRGTSSLPYFQPFTNYIPYKQVEYNLKTLAIARRESGVSRFIDVSFEGTWFQDTFGAVDNSLTTVVYYRDTTDNELWESLPDFIDGASIGYLDTQLLDTSTPGVFKYNGPIMSAEEDKGFDIKVSYDFVIGVLDAFSTWALTITAPYGEPAIALYKNKAALGGPYDESLGGTQLWDDVYLNGEKLEIPEIPEQYVHQRHIVSAYLGTVWEHDFTAWTSVDAPLDTSTVIGNKLSFSDYYVHIGAGVKQVLVSGSAYFSSDIASTQIRAWTRLKDADGTNVFTVPSYAYAPEVGCNMAISVPPIIMDVSEGQKISLMVQIGKTQTGTILARATSLYVEVIE